MTLEEVKQDINSFKQKALTLCLNTVIHPDAKYLEPREIKTLTDVVLNLEDSYKNQSTEGETARKITRLLSKYASEDPQDLTIDTTIVMESQHG